ncbi:MAG TPA: argininosuccinate lyase [Jatrophihabitans sp.]|nr:argininosuccinate lyase [Jatrophihabitans sp.]
MSAPGRLTGEVGVRTRRLIYGELAPPDLQLELSYLSRVDQAHLLMLAAQGLVPAEAARTLLTGIEQLRADGYRQLFGRPAPRGIYLMYEGYLSEQLGPEIGGQLHTGRSRNDLKATITAMRLRDWLLDFAGQAARLEAVLLARARAYRTVLMPVYTHYQAAMPVSYGYYLLGVGRAVGRDLDAIQAAADGLRVCPLGAGAVAGSDLPIDPARTARLLGFSRPSAHALDAVASRDAALRVLAAATGLAITVSRLAADLQLWSTVEFGLVRFPDRLVGGSSAMPQKRNAFLLEHVRAKPALAVGAWTAAATAMSATPFTNSIEVGTEAVSAIWPGLLACEHAVLLCQTLVSGARPVPERMRERAAAGFTNATALANQLVRQAIPFRTAHQLVGDAVRQAVAAGSTDLAGYGPPGWLDGVDPAMLDLDGLLEAQAHGGGPGAFGPVFTQSLVEWSAHRDWCAEWRRGVAEAEAELSTAVRQLLACPPATSSAGDAA